MFDRLKNWLFNYEEDASHFSKMETPTLDEQMNPHVNQEASVLKSEPSVADILIDSFENHPEEWTLELSDVLSNQKRGYLIAVKFCYVSKVPILGELGVYGRKDKYEFEGDDEDRVYESAMKLKEKLITGIPIVSVEKMKKDFGYGA
jgi:hypothetical protein